MSQVSLTKPDNKPSLVGSEAKSPLPSKTKVMISCTDMIGLSWIFLEDPLNISELRLAK